MVTSVVPVVGGQPASQPLDLKKGVASVAKTDEVGELFRYAIGTPVTLAHSQSALLPIVNEPIKGQRVSIYDPQVQAKHPLAGLLFRNTTKLHLMQGPDHRVRRRRICRRRSDRRHRAGAAGSSAMRSI